MNVWQVLTVAYGAVGTFIGWEGLKVHVRIDAKYQESRWLEKTYTVVTMFALLFMFWPIFCGFAVKDKWKARKR